MSIPKVNNSKKISELHARDTITTYQNNSWLAVAQYNSLIGAYHNIAINLEAITSYSIENSRMNTETIIDDKLIEFALAYGLAYWIPITYANTEYDYAYIKDNVINNSLIASNLVTYTTDSIMWEYFPSKEINITRQKYMMSEDGEFILTDKGKKIRVE